MTLDAPRPAPADAPSFAAVAEELLDDVYGYLLYLTKNWALAEDLTSETFETALRRWQRFDPRRGTHACVAARHRALDRARLVPRRRAAPRREERAEAARAATPRAAFGEGFSPELEEALRALTAGEREVVALRVVLDLDGEETAACSGSRPPPSRRGCIRALGKLEERMRDHDAVA